MLLEAPAVLMFAVLLGVAAGRLDREAQLSRPAAASLGSHDLAVQQPGSAYAL
jgi:uncharacterized protein YfiM (DUF2279 family)